MSKSDLTRQRIIETTAPIFNTKGYAGTSISDLTEAIGLTKGSIYGNFESKDEVALAAFDYNLGQVQKAVAHEMNKERTAKGKLLVYARAYDEFLHLPFPKGGCPILNTAVEADDTHPALKKKAADALQQWKQQITRLVEKGIADGEFGPVDHIEQLAVSMIALIEGGIMMTKVTGKMHYKALVRQFVERMIDDLS